MARAQFRTEHRLVVFVNCQTQHPSNLSHASTSEIDSDHFDYHEPWWLRFMSLITRSHISVVETLVFPVHQMAKRSHPSTDEASKFTGASSKSQPVGKRILALAAVRHHKELTVEHSSKKKTQSGVKGQVHSSQASGDGVAFPFVFTSIFETQNA